ncbi:MAG TPA: hypothetical protein VE913_20195 [Longimicrobium sp.]|nr:hypothetical protein [Longimicrobium sp.]
MFPKFRTLFPFFAVLALSLGGCAEVGAPTTAMPVEEGALFDESGSSSNLQALARFQQRPIVTSGWAKMWIGPAGGRLDFQGFAIEVPAGAVTRYTQFSIRLPVDPSGSERVVAEFGPHAQAFGTQVFIELPYRNTNIEGAPSPTIVWWNNRWEDVGGTLTADGNRLRTAVGHFSTYGTGSAQTFSTFELGGGISTSGG